MPWLGIGAHKLTGAERETKVGRARLNTAIAAERVRKMQREFFFMVTGSLASLILQRIYRLYIGWKNVQFICVLNTPCC